MRILPVILCVLAIGACKSASVTDDDIPVTAAASTACIDNTEWAYTANRGAPVYGENCAYCHKRDGSGQAGQVPALAGNEQLIADPARGLKLMFITKTPQALVHGMTFEDMVAIFDDLSEQDMANVMTYVLSSWGNCGGPVTVEQVKAVGAQMDAG